MPPWLTPGVLLAAGIQLGVPVDQVRPIAFVKAHPERAFLLIHCDTDEQVAVHHAYDLKAASANPGTRLWIEHGCNHATGFEHDPDGYTAQVLAFLHEQLR
jgi:fermentation-respiration switch protein FrsA (DUF1100 family)